MSTKFNTETCREILGRVDGSQTGIQNASARLVYWKRNASDVVRCWEQAFQKADMDKRLVLIYLANDIAQTSRRSGREYIEAFHKALPEAFKHMMKHSDERVQQKLKKLVHVWRDRNLWGNKALSLYTDMVRGVSTPSETPKQPIEKLQSSQEDLTKVISLLKTAQQAHSDLEKAMQGENSTQMLQKCIGVPITRCRQDLEPALAKLDEVAAAHRSEQAAQEAIIAEYRRLVDVHVAELQTSKRQLQTIQHRKEEVQQKLNEDQSSPSPAVPLNSGMGRNLASAGVPPSVPDLMSGSPRPAMASTLPPGNVYSPSGSMPVPLPQFSNGNRSIEPSAAPHVRSRRDPRAVPVQSIPSAPVIPPLPMPQQPDTIEQLANMDPTESAALLTSIIQEAPQDVVQQFGAALVQQVVRQPEAI